MVKQVLRAGVGLPVLHAIFPLFGLLLLPPLAGQTVVFEDSFDSQPLVGGGTALANWSVTSGSVDVIGPGYFDFYPGNGHYLDMDGSATPCSNTSATIQSAPLLLCPGAYELSFEIGNAQFSGNDLHVELGTAYNEHFSVPGGFPPLTSVTRTIVVRTETITPLVFQETGPSDCGGVVLDDVMLLRELAPLTVVFEDGFDSQPLAGGATTLANWSVTSGSVDVIGPGYSDFYPGNGHYLDMDGSANPCSNTSATIQSAPLLLSPGAYVLSFEIGNAQFSGNDLHVELGTAYNEHFSVPGGFPPLTSVTRAIVVRTEATIPLVFQEAGPSDCGGVVLDDVMLLRAELAPWSNLNGGTPGVKGTPLLTMSGPLIPASLVTLDLVDGAPSSVAIVFVSFTSTPAAFLGGTLHTFPLDDLVVVGTDAAGEVHGSALFCGAPSGTNYWFQVGIQDSSVPIYGASLSNGVKGTVP